MIDLDALRADYESGLSLTDTARKHYISHVTAWKRLIEMGVEMRPSGRRRRENPKGYFQLQKTAIKETNS